MPTFLCYPPEGDETIWQYCPSFSAAVAFCVVFFLLTCLHIFQGFYFRKPFLMIIMIAGMWETIGYGLRIRSIEKQLGASYYSGQQLLALLAPIWLNSFIYMVFARMVHYYIRPTDIFGLDAQTISNLFIATDIIVIIVQAVGSIMSTPGTDPSVTRTGLNVYTGGVALQIICQIICFVFAFKFDRLLVAQNLDYENVSTAAAEAAVAWRAQPGKRNRRRPPRLPPAPPPPPETQSQALRLLYTLCASLGLIILRNVYRLAEYSLGEHSSIARLEWAFYLFDAAPICCAMVLLSVFHPCATMKGPGADFSRRAAWNREKKVMNGGVKQKREKPLF